jgi:hypothetical protein
VNVKHVFIFFKLSSSKSFLLISNQPKKISEKNFMTSAIPSFSKIPDTEEEIQPQVVTADHPFGIAGIRTEIFSHIERWKYDKPFAVLSEVCKSWRQSVSDSEIAGRQLEAVTSLTYDEILNWQLIFRHRYQQDLSLSELIKKCPNLTTLDFSNSKMVKADIENIFKQIAAAECKSLKELKFQNYWYESSYLDLKILSFIKKLDLSGSGIPIESIEGMDSLEELDLSHSSGVIDRLCDLPNLKILKMRSCNVFIKKDFSNLPFLEEIDFTDSFFRSISIIGLKALKKISYANCRGLGESGTIDNLPCLEELNYEGASIKKLLLDKDYPFLSCTTLSIDNCTDLKELNCEGAPYLQTLSAKEAKNLHTLITPSFLFLKNLDLSGTRISSIEFKKEKYPSLKIVKLNNCKTLKTVSFTELSALEEIDLSHSKNLDKLDMKKLINLRKIALNKCFGLMKLHGEGLANLKELDFKDSKALFKISLEEMPLLETFDVSGKKNITSVHLVNMVFLKSAKLNNCKSLESFSFEGLPQNCIFSFDFPNNIFPFGYSLRGSFDIHPDIAKLLKGN